MDRADRPGAPEPDVPFRPQVDDARDLIWPVGIAVALLLVVLINVGFIVVAVGGADEVVESYTTEAR